MIAELARRWSEPLSQLFRQQIDLGIAWARAYPKLMMIMSRLKQERRSAEVGGQIFVS